MDTYHSRDCKLKSFYPFLPHVTPWSQQFRILPFKRDIEPSLMQSTRRWPFHRSIEPDGSEVEITEQLAHKVRHRQWRGLSSYITPPSQWQTLQTIDPDEFKMTLITSNGCNWLPDTGEFTTAPLNASIHSRNLQCLESNWHARRITDIEDKNDK